MKFRYDTKRINTFKGECFVIEEVSSGRNVKLFKNEVDTIMSHRDSGYVRGVFPHAGYVIDKGRVFIEHSEDREHHSIDMALSDLTAIVNLGIGVFGGGSYIDYKGV